MNTDRDFPGIPELDGLDPARRAEILEASADAAERTLPYGLLSLAATGSLFAALWLGRGIAERTGSPVLGFFPAGFLMSLEMIGFWFGRLALVRREARRRADQQ
ncbi:MAG: hypothetical protein MUC63_11130 [Planctomycetes bacterium]|jgi:hypothetical protein|nr:hypothetical protein [Planctomycetota bacterium]